MNEDPQAQSTEAGTLTVSRYREVSEVLNSRAFAQSGHEASDDVLEGTIVNLEGPAHQKRARIEQPLFKRAQLQRYEKLVLQPSIDRCIGECPVSDDGLRHIDVVALSRKMLTQIAAAIIGLDDVDTPERTERLASFGDRLAKAARLKFVVGDQQAARRELLADKHAFIDEFVVDARRRHAELVQRWRDGQLERAELPQDLLTQLLVNEDPDWDDDLINREVILYLVASTLTTAQAVPHSVFHISAWIEQHPDDRERLQDVEFLRHAAYESMRLHASSPVQMRRAVTDVTLKNGETTVPAGVEILVDGGASNLDPDVFGDDATDYDPYRSPKEPRVRLYGHTFAAGAHRCAGEHLAAGMPTSPGKDNGTQGMVIQILRSLYEHGLQTYPDRPPVDDPDTTADFYVSYPATLADT